jgi:CRP-like cAMP-binding protein
VFLSSGRAEAGVKAETKTPLALTIIQPGEIFGELAVLTNQKQSATVTAVEPSEVVLLHRNEFFILLRERPAIAEELLRILAFRVLRLTEQVKILGLKSGYRRVAAALLFLTRFCDERRAQLTEEYVGRFCEMSYRQVLRVFEAFKKAGLVEVDPKSRTIAVVDEHGLSRFVVTGRKSLPVLKEGPRGKPLRSAIPRPRP